MGYGRQKWQFFSTIGRHLECAIQTELVVELGLVWFRGLTPQQQPGSYQGGEMMMKSVFWWRKPEHPEETTDLRQVTDETFSHIRPLPSPGIELGPQRCEFNPRTGQRPHRKEAISLISAQFYNMPGRYERRCVGWHCAKVKGQAELKIEKI